MARSANSQLTILLANFAPKRLILLASTLWYTNTIKKKKLYFAFPGLFSIIYFDTKPLANSIKETNKCTHVDEIASHKVVTSEKEV